MAMPLARGANSSHPYLYGGKMMMAGGEFLVGTLSSLQNNPEGKPSWIVSGLWKATLPSSKANTTSAAPTSGNNTGTNTSSTGSGKFASMFNMVMINGSALHKHTIYNATITKVSNPDNKTTIMNGTAIVTMKNGPVSNVPISIKIMDDSAVSIWLDPTKTNNHFGNKPIFGTVVKHVLVKK